MYNHVDAKVAKSALPPEVWRYKKISILRDPYDCVISWYYWANKHRSTSIEFEDFLFSDPSIIVDNYNLVKVRGVCVLDYILRYSDFENSILELERDIPSLQGLWSFFSSINAKGDVRPKAEVSSADVFFDKHVRAKKLIDLLLEKEPLARVY